MNILAVDTSGNVCSAAVLRGEKLLSESYMDDKKTHSETIAPMVDECLARVGMEVNDIDLFCCAVGPGSFTGLRIGTALIKAFAHASGKPAVGVNTLDALAANVSGTSEMVCPMIDARRGEVYTATYRDGERVSDYRAVPLESVLSELRGESVMFVGDGAMNYREKIVQASPSFRIAHSGMVLQRASSVGLVGRRMAQNGDAQDAYTLEPFYLRETQAERVLAQKQREARREG